MKLERCLNTLFSSREGYEGPGQEMRSERGPPIPALAVKHSGSHFLISYPWFSAALMRITHSAGRHQVRGNILYSLGKSLSMRLRLRASKSLRQISIIPGKWLIF